MPENQQEVEDLATASAKASLDRSEIEANYDRASAVAAGGSSDALASVLGSETIEGQGAACNRVLRRSQITRALLQQAGKCSGFWQKLHRGTADVLVYQELGFTTTVQFTFEVLPAPETELWRGMRDKTRNSIRRAEEQYVVATLTDFETFGALYVKNLERRGVRSYCGKELISAACEAAHSRGQGRVLTARTHSGDMAASIVYIWDAQAAYYLLSTRNKAAGNGAVSLLVWHAMRDIAARGLIFDFDGVPNSGSALFFTGFGGRITPRYVVSRHSLGHRIAGRMVNPFRSRSEETYF